MKSRTETSEIVVGLDIGTTKVIAVVGEVDADGITILGVGNVPCRGLRKGIVSNIDWTARSIADAIEAAQTMAGVEIRTVYAGVAGNHIRCQGSAGVVAIAGGEVTPADVDRVLEGARAIPIDADRQILHALPREFTVDTKAPADGGHGGHAEPPKADGATKDGPPPASAGGRPGDGAGSAVRQRMTGSS